MLPARRATPTLPNLTSRTLGNRLISRQQPFLLVVAGPNGSGKSTLTDYLIEAGVDFGEYINPDVIAAALDAPEPQRSKRAQAIADISAITVLTAVSASALRL